MGLSTVGARSSMRTFVRDMMSRKWIVKGYTTSRPWVCISRGIPLFSVSHSSSPYMKGFAA
jgi:hypothetical protein